MKPRHAAGVLVIIFLATCRSTDISSFQTAPSFVENGSSIGNLNQAETLDYERDLEQRQSTANSSYIITVHPESTIIPGTQLPSTNPTSIEPEYIRVCPDSPIVGWTELGVASNLRLLVEPAEEMWQIRSGISILSPNARDPILIASTIPPEGWAYSGYTPVLNGTELLSFHRRKVADSIEVWLSEGDGENAKLVSSILSDEWAYVYDPRQLVVLGQPIERFGDSRDAMPIYTIDLVSNEIVDLDPLPGKAVFHSLLFFDKRPYAFVYDWGSFNDLNLFSYETGDLIPILSWFEHQDGVNQLSTKFGVTDLGLYAFVEQSYGLDYLPPIDLEGLRQVRAYGSIMQPIILPGEPKSIIPHIQVYELGENNSFLLWKDDLEGPPFLYRLDLEQGTLTDYCLSKIPFVSVFHISPDGNYLAVTSMTQQGWNSQIAEGTYVLDLNTGLKADLGPVAVNGWTVVP